MASNTRSIRHPNAADASAAALRIAATTVFSSFISLFVYAARRPYRSTRRIFSLESNISPTTSLNLVIGDLQGRIDFLSGP